MTRRLLGYVVKLPDGTRSPHTPEPLPATEALRAALFEVPTGTYLVPVFATPKRQTLTDIPPEVFAYSDNEGGVCLTWPMANAEKMRATEEAKGTYKCGPIVRYVPEPKPAPAEGAAERYVLFCPNGTTGDLYDVWFDQGGVFYTGTRANVATAQTRHGRGVPMRLFEEGAHEAVVAAARREERERCAREFCEAMGAHPSGSWDGVLDVARLLKDVCEKTIERRNEAAKGQAK